MLGHSALGQLAIGEGTDELALIPFGGSAQLLIDSVQWMAALQQVNSSANIIANPRIRRAAVAGIASHFGQPNSNVVSTEIPFLSLVVREDSSWARLKYNEIEYEFANKDLRANPYQRGVYVSDLLPGITLNSLYGASQDVGYPGPDNQLTAVLLSEDSDDAYHGVFQNISKPSAVGLYTFFGDFKYAGAHLQIGFGSSDLAAGNYTTVNLINGEVIWPSSFWGANNWLVTNFFVSKQSNGYWRIGVTAPSDNSTSVTPFLQINHSGTTDDQAPVQGDGVSGFYYTNLTFRKTGS